MIDVVSGLVEVMAALDTLVVSFPEDFFAQGGGDGPVIGTQGFLGATARVLEGDVVAFADHLSELFLFHGPGPVVDNLHEDGVDAEDQLLEEGNDVAREEIHVCGEVEAMRDRISPVI